jgi:hypothetical protein
VFVTGTLEEFMEMTIATGEEFAGFLWWLNISLHVQSIIS